MVICNVIFKHFVLVNIKNVKINSHQFFFHALLIIIVIMDVILLMYALLIVEKVLYKLLTLKNK